MAKFNGTDERGLIDEMSLQDELQARICVNIGTKKKILKFILLEVNKNTQRTQLMMVIICREYDKNVSVFVRGKLLIIVVSSTVRTNIVCKLLCFFNVIHLKF